MATLRIAVKGYWTLITVFITLFFLSGCMGKSKPSNFYMLYPIKSATMQGGMSIADTMHIQVGPITMPTYLERSQIVITTETNQLIVDEFNRWAEPLIDNFSRVLVENLSQLLKTPNVHPYASGNVNGPDIIVSIDITRFDVTQDGNAYLNVFWTLSDKSADEPQVTRKNYYHTQAESKDMSDAVRSQNNLLAEFSNDIADAVRSIR